MDGEDSINHLRVASFSAYLNTPEEKNFVLKLDGAIMESSPAIISPEETPRSSGRSKTKEGEISIFGADKYFNMKMDYGTRGMTDNKERKQWQKKEDRDDLHHLKPRFRTGTPSAPSEASWNSQAALLPSLAKASPQMKQKRAIGKRFFLGFGCSVPCMDKKSVHTSESAEQNESKQSQHGSKRGDHFAFPILNPGVENLPVKKQLEEEEKKTEEEARKSLEVFGSSTTKKGDIAVNLERKLSMLTWDAIPKAPTLPTTLVGSCTAVCDDMASDASSDLFEIENISGTGQYSLLTRQASDNMSGCMTPTTLYEPSEASIEWSVVTASVADVSVISDYDEKYIINAGDMTGAITTSKAAKTRSIASNAQKNLPGGLLGCRAHKAVSVAETAYRANGKASPI
ncbi:protein PHYTOCHROME KINASE SUBSTRATE 3-like [Cornus florida]|uniref:protein PHYTOCHROME KINASE SUBSTRATE 3-like n=1 Tax=Cornus florida TaxID=4283 RepID=UPI002899CD2A|nr:protein PHYTOCHROME KINASE SUBSTRATE 3-like [Cornus florida]